MNGELSECLSGIIMAEIRLFKNPQAATNIREDLELSRDLAMRQFLDALDEQIDRRAAWIAGTEKGK